MAIGVTLIREEDRSRLRGDVGVRSIVLEQRLVCRDIIPEQRKGRTREIVKGRFRRIEEEVNK